MFFATLLFIPNIEKSTKNASKFKNMFRYLFLFFTLIALTACTGTKNTSGDKDTPPDNTLKCNSTNVTADIAWIGELADNFKGGRVKAKITRYELDGEYYFEVNNCVNCADAMTVLYTCDHGKKCETGGIAGFQTCGDFYERVGEGEIVWKNYEDSDK